MNKNNTVSNSKLKSGYISAAIFRHSLLCIMALMLIAGNASSQVVNVGTFTGTGSPQSISLGYKPDVVIISASGQPGFIKTSTMTANASKSMASAAATVTDAITSFTSGGFDIGTNTSVNSPGTTYYYYAWKASADIAVGTFTGTGATQLRIPLTFRPSYVLIIPESSDQVFEGFLPNNNADYWTHLTGTTQQQSTANSVGGSSFELSGGASYLYTYNCGGTGTSSGSKGLNANVSGTTYNYVAFNSVAGFIKAGSYVGNGSSQSISGLGFKPGLVLIKGVIAAVQGTSNCSSPVTYYAGPSLTQNVAHRNNILIGNTTLDFAGSSSYSGGITSLNADGFSLGSDATVNASTTDNLYRYVAFLGSFISTGNLSSFITCPANPSGQQSYSVSGVGLTNDITITPPAGYELSLTSGSGFSTNPIILTQSGGSVPATTIYVRLNSSSGTYNGNITHVSGSTSANVSVTGTVTNLTATIGGTTAVCKNASSPNITFTGNNGNAPYTFIYKLNGVTQAPLTSSGGSNPVSKTLAVPTGATGTFTYELLTVKDANNCSQAQSGTAVVTVNAPPATVSPDLVAAFCFGSSATLTASSGSSYQWKKNGSAISGANSQTYNATTPGNYSVVVTDAGCFDESYGVAISVKNDAAKKTVNENPLPVISASNGGSVCEGQTITLSSNSDIGINYFWTGPNGYFSLQQNPSISNSTVLNGGTYTVVAAAITGCINSATTTVLVNPTPVATATNNSQVICSGSGFLSIGLGTSNSVFGTSFSWTRNNTGTVTGIAASGSGDIISTPLTNTTNAPVTVTFTITPTGPAPYNCAGSSITAAITVNPIPTINVSPASQPAVCSNVSISPIALTNPNNVSGTSYSWSRNNTTNLAGLESGTGSPVSGSLLNVTNSQQTTTFTILATANGCSSSTTATVTVNPAPIVDASPSSLSTCGAFSVGITNTNNVSGTTYSWTRTNVSGLSGVPLTGSSSSAFNLAGTFANSTGSPLTSTFTVTGTAGGCSLSATSSVTVNPTPALSLYPATQTICSGDVFTSVNITDTRNITYTTVDYTWTRNNTVNLPGFVSGTGATIPGFSFVNNTGVQQSTVWTVTAVAGSCVSTGTSTVIVNPLPAAPSISPNPSVTVCHGDNATLSASGSAGSLIWSTGASSPTILVGIPGIYTVKTTDANGCTSVASVSTTVNVNSKPTAIITGASEYCEGTPTDLNACSSVAGTGTVSAYQWYKNGALIPGAVNCIYTVSGPTADYSVKVTNSANCSSTVCP